MSPSPAYRIETCRDGSHTVWSENFGQFYHNPNGAVAESLYVFLQIGELRQKLEHADEVDVIEVGFGTGLNLLLCVDLIEEMKFQGQLHFYSVEAWPLHPNDAIKLNYAQFLKHPDKAPSLAELFSSIKTGWNTIQVHPNVQVHLFVGLFREMNYPSELQADVVFFDAFSPSANPELWKVNIFEQLINHCKASARLVTYCASSEARTAMALAGWKIAKAPGALGKREMTIASPTESTLHPHTILNSDRLIERFKQGDFPNLS